MRDDADRCFELLRHHDVGTGIMNRARIGEKPHARDDLKGRIQEMGRLHDALGRFGVVDHYGAELSLSNPRRLQNMEAACIAVEHRQPQIFEFLQRFRIQLHD